MSLGDELRFLRAKAGGPTPLEIAEATGIDAGLYRQLEQRYREMGDDDIIEKLAAYFDCDSDVLKNARPWSRKALSQHLVRVLAQETTIELHLRTGEMVAGHPVWWDLGAIGLKSGDGSLVVVQRHAVIRW